MNIIRVEEDVSLKLKQTEIDFEYHIGTSAFDISKFNLNIKKNTNIYIYLKKEDIKLDFIIDTAENIKANLYIYHELEKEKVKTTVNVSSNSIVNIFKLNDSLSIKEGIILNLFGKNSTSNLNIKSVAKNAEVYDIVANHLNHLTTSNINNKMINLSGNITIQVSTYIDENLKETYADQKNTIINLTNKKCEVKPNLYIDSDDAIANHSAFIGKFDKETLFYLTSRGLSLKEANNLLIKGFLESDIQDKKIIKNIHDIIKKYWR